MWRCTGQPTVGSPDYHCLWSEDTIFTSIIKFQYSNQDKNHAKEKPINHFQRSLRGESCSCCYKSTKDSSPLTCDLCLGILIKKNAKSGCSSHLESKWLYLGISQYFQSQQAGLPQQAALLSNQNDLPEPAQLCSQESKQSSSPATPTANRQQNGAFCTLEQQGLLWPLVILTKYICLCVSLLGRVSG